MKLIGSNTENIFREIMLQSHFDLFNTNNDTTILHILKTNFNYMKTAYFLDHIPDSDSDFYIILIDTNIIIKLEINREQNIFNLEKTSSEEYKKGLSKLKRIKLAVATELAEKDIGARA